MRAKHQCISFATKAPQSFEERVKTKSSQTAVVRKQSSCKDHMTSTSFMWTVTHVWFFFFLTSLLEYNCFTMLCQFLLYNKVNQLYVCIYPHISSLLRLPPTLPIPPLQVVTKHGADIPVLCSCFPLAICFTFGSIYMSVLLSHFIPAYPYPSTCPQVHSLHLHLYSCPAPRFIRTIFFQIPYICVSIWYLFFSF